MMLNVSKKKPRSLTLVHSVGFVSNSVWHRSFMRMIALQVCERNIRITYLFIELGVCGISALVAQSVSAFGC